MLMDIVTDTASDAANFSLSDANLNPAFTQLADRFEAVAQADARRDTIAAARLFFAVYDAHYAGHALDDAFDDYHAFLRERGTYINLRSMIDALLAGRAAL